MSENNSLKNFSYVNGGRISTSILLGAFYLIFAVTLDPEIYGELSYLISIAGTVSIIARFGTPHSVVVYRSKENHLLSNQLNVFAVITVGIASVILISIDVYTALLCFTSTMFILNLQNLLGLKKYKKFLLFSVIRGGFVIILSVGLYFVLDIPGIILGLAIGNIITTLSFFKSLRFNIHSFDKLRSNFKVLLHNFGVDSSQSLINWIDKLLIVPLFGFVLVGLYQFNFQILLALSIMPTALHSFLLSERSSGKKQTKINRLAIFTSVVLVIVVIFISPNIIEQIFPKFIEGIFALQILVIALVPYTTSAILTSNLQAKESTTVGYSAIVKITSLLISIAILGNFYGLVGLSIAVVLSAILENAALFILQKKSIK